MSFLREVRIGWAQGGVIRNLRTLDRIDPGWRARKYGRQMLHVDTAVCMGLHNGRWTECAPRADRFPPHRNPHPRH